MKMYTRDADQWRVVSANHFLATYQGGGFWSLESRGNLIAAWITKDEVRKIIRQGRTA